MTRVVIPSVQRFDTDASGQTVNIVRHAGDLHLECVPVDDLNAAAETTMNDPLPDRAALKGSIPKYSNDVSSYIDDFAHREQSEAAAGLRYAPKDSDLPSYPPRIAAIWKSVFADYDAGQQAYRAGQVYVAYQLFMRANGRMTGANALAGQTRASFNVKTALAESDDLHDHLHILMNPPTIDKGGLESAVLVAEMADWAYEINAASKARRSSPSRPTPSAPTPPTPRRTARAKPFFSPTRNPSTSSPRPISTRDFSLTSPGTTPPPSTPTPRISCPS